MTYRLEGLYRGGPVYGDARVHWQREGARYRARLELAVRFFGSVRMTSEGDATPLGLLPRAFEEIRPGQRRVARFGGQVVALERGKRALRPPGLQDTVSQFVELAHRFATGRDALAVGHSVSFPMARPDGIDHWTYDVVASEMLPTPELGAIEAFHLKPRPIANPRGDITAEMWFAPSLQYLPVRIRCCSGTAPSSTWWWRRSSSAERAYFGRWSTTRFALPMLRSMPPAGRTSIFAVVPT
ncbi:DUF3108 domain-containing protein [Ramlibacter terrae]|uniref:DUF3108 domain-containing protein n=1 Tax=Ramlibacter terrae TaxID=2732511 RepID=A0ABX6P6G0_9BURK|nr:DUF3108 domain-containing protein [Ramlibacter terrae]